MGSNFFALPVRGEAFLLETHHKRRKLAVLVDGGQDRGSDKHGHPIVKAIKSASPHLNQIDIAICTHNDADHAGGFPSFPEYWLRAKGSIREVWLPWRWSSALPLALTDPDHLLSMLAEGSLQLADQVDRWHRVESHEQAASGAEAFPLANLEATIRAIGQELFGRTAAISEVSEPRDWSALSVDMINVAAAENNDEAIGRALGLSVNDLISVRQRLEETSEADMPQLERQQNYFRFWAFPFSARARSFVASTFDTAEKIRAIAAAAAQHNILVRWFDFDAFEKGKAPSGGVADFLLPVNTVEMRVPRPETNALKLALALRLTEQNVESLVFQRLEEEHEPAVFFLGDSRLAFGVSRPGKNFPKPMSLPSRSALITAPHHGSRVNDRAYRVLEEWLGSDLANQCFFVRNGGMWKQTLEGFLRRLERRCAQCQQCFKNGRGQVVTVKATAGSWSWESSARPCGTPATNSSLIRLA